MKGRRLLWLLVALVALAAALPTLAARWRAEQENVRVELAMDYLDLLELSQAEGLDIDAVLGALRAAGLNSITLRELTLRRLAAGDPELAAVVHPGHYLLGLLAADQGHPLAGLNGVRAEATYVVTADPALARWLSDALTARFPGQVRSLAAGGSTVLELSRSFPGIADQGLGLWPADLARIRRAGLLVMAWLYNYPAVDPAAIDRTLSQLQGTGSTVLLDGLEAFGYPQYLADTARSLDRYGLLLGLVEHPVQRGFVLRAGSSDLARLTGLRCARVHQLSRREVDKLTPAEVIDKTVRSVRERNLRVACLLPFRELPLGTDPLAVNVSLVTGLAEGLRQAGFELAPAQPYRVVTVPLWERWAVATAAAAAGVALCEAVIPLAAATAGSALAAGSLLSLPLLHFRPVLGAQATGLALALVFPALAVTMIWEGWRRARLHPGGQGLTLAAQGLVSASLISLLGGLLLSAAMADSLFLLEVELFRGVKLAHLFPPVAVGLVALVSLERQRRGTAGGAGPGRALRGLLGQEIPAGHILALLLLAVAGVVYIGRTGHELGLPPFPYEEQARHLLERALLVRPRTKEFLIGHPLLLSAGMALAAFPEAQWLSAGLAVGGVIGQISIINSFEHVRSPLALSVVRSVNGLWVGLLVGLVAAWVILRLSALGRRLLQWRG
ncbi:MAG: DUF5693 family protein [Bacillota bacterium]